MGTVTLKHAFQSSKTDGSDSTLVQPSNWNAAHVLQMVGPALLGNAGTGSGEVVEISLGTGFSFSNGFLNCTVTGTTNLSETTTATGVTIASSTGTSATIAAASSTSAGVMVAADKSKLDGVSPGATTNATDAQLRDRSTHTGTQAISTVVNLQSTLDAKASPSDITTAINSLVGAAPATLNTLVEIAAAINNDPNVWSTVAANLAAVVGGAPTALNTLNKISAAINNDASFSSTITTALATKQAIISPDISFSTTIPLNNVGTFYMPQQTVSSVLTFTVGSNPAKNSTVYVRLLADGVNAPVFTGWKEWGGSLGYDNRLNIANEIQFFFDGYEYWYAISQAVNATAYVATVPVVSAAIVANGAATLLVLTTSATLDTAYTPATSAFAVTNKTVTAVAVGANTVTLTVTPAFTVSEVETASYTQPASNGVRSVTGDLMASFSARAITNSVVGAATALTMTGPVSGTTGSASSNFTVGVTPVGGTITGTVVVTPSDGGVGGTFTPTTASITSASPTATFTYTRATDGASTISLANNGGLTAPSTITYTSSTAVTSQVVRFGSLVSLTESGASPGWTYTSTATSFGANGGVSTVGLQNGVDGQLSVVMGSVEFIFGLTTSSTPVAFSNMPYGIWTRNGLGMGYGVITAGAIDTTGTVSNATNDILRLRRVGTTLYAEVARAATPTVFTTIKTWTGVPTTAYKFDICPSTGGSLNTPTGMGLA